MNTLMPSDPIFTVGHSNRTLSEFTDILRAAEIQALVDVRRFPASRRHPHFNLPPLRAHLASIGIVYHHFPELGGYRSPSDAGSASPNDGWPSGFLRSYADYALTEAFQSALLRLRQSAQTATALMCAEKSWKDCHRQIITDYLIANGHHVIHLVDAVNREDGRLTAFATLSERNAIHYRTNRPQLRLDL
jgi:uncharacterized protein (DUF488 family)